MAENKFRSEMKKRLSRLRLPKLRQLQRADIITLIASFVIALLLWSYIAANVMQEYTVQLNKIPLTVEIANSRAASYGLNLTPESQAAVEALTVDGTVTGSRSAYGALKSSDVVAYVDFNSTVAAAIGTQTLPIRLRTVSGEELTNFSLSRSSVTVEMDRYEKRSFPVNDVVYPFLTWDDDTRISKDDITYEPSTVEIYGPSRRLSQIDHICVNIINAEELTQTKTFSDCADFSLKDSDGNEVDAAPFNVQTTRFSVRIPVYYSRELPVTINIANPPTGFDTETIMKRIRITANDVYTLPGYGENNLNITIETADPDNKATLEALETWTIESLALSQLSKTSSVNVPITMPKGFVDKSHIDSVTISLDSTDLQTKQIWVKNSDILLINPDPKYHYALESPGGNTLVTLIGTQEELNKIEEDALKCSVNLVNISVSTEGVYSRPFTVKLPDTVSGVWVSPEPNVSIRVSVNT